MRSSEVDIEIDPEFAVEVPLQTPAELAQLRLSLIAEGCRDPLILWQGSAILVDGQHRWPLLQELDIPFRIERREFADRQAVKDWIVAQALGRKSLSPLAESCLRGERYNREKRHPGRPQQKSGQFDHFITSQLLAEHFRVSPKTIRRDGQLATALKSITDNCGPEVRQPILARHRGLTRSAVHWLASLEAGAQREAMATFLKTGKLPKRCSIEDEPAMITLPAEPQAGAKRLLKLLGPEQSRQFLHALAAMIETEAPTKWVGGPWERVKEKGERRKRKPQDQ